MEYSLINKSSIKKQPLFLLMLAVAVYSCKSINSQTEKAEEVYLCHLKTIESFVKIENDSLDGNSLDEAIIFL